MIEYDVYYLKQLHLLNFKKIGSLSEHKYNFRCPICGDSKKDRNKQRGYAIPSVYDNTTLHIYCHNCGYSKPFIGFLKDVNSQLYTLYKMQKFSKDKQENRDKFVDREETNVRKNINRVPLIMNLLLVSIHDSTVPRSVIQYIYSRGISVPNIHCFYSSDFGKYLKQTYNIDIGFTQTQNKERIVFPIYNKNRELLGFQARIIGNSVDKKNRFITKRLVDNEPLFYGVEKLDHSKPIILTEGIFDSLSVTNGCAMLTAIKNFNTILEYFKGDKIIFVLDNEPNNHQIVSHYNDIIDKMEQNGNVSFFAWPEEFKVIKDLNQLFVGVKKCHLGDQEKMYEMVVNKAVNHPLHAKLWFKKWRNK